MNSKKFAKRMKDSGVSPVIATILMVAITVVLAAVLYVMVSGFTHSPGTANSAGLSVTNSGSSWVVSVDKVSSSGIALSNLKIEAISGSSTAIYAYTYTTGTPNTITFVTSASSFPTTITYSSTGTISSTTTLSAGDTFSVGYSSGSLSTSGLPSGTTFEILDGNSVLTSITLQ